LDALDALDISDRTAPGIFFRFQVTDFDLLGFFLLCHFIFLSRWVVLFQRHRRSVDARLLRPVLESGHPDESISLSCAWAFDFLTLRRAHTFCSSVHSRWLCCYQHPCQVWQNLVKIRMVSALLIEHEGVTQRFDAENKQWPLQKERT
jgi:hypothetical protein